MSSPKVWLITGASRGFGRRWTEAALARGDKVAAAMRPLIKQVYAERLKTWESWDNVSKAAQVQQVGVTS
jgi:NAD(P)-dependent dehydrogenase (short-subunit alcohol dehydrogenase family)